MGSLFFIWITTLDRLLLLLASVWKFDNVLIRRELLRSVDGFLEEFSAISKFFFYFKIYPDVRFCGVYGFPYYT